MDMTPIIESLSDQRVAVRLIDVGQKATSNTRLLDLRLRDPMAQVDVPVTLIATLRHDGDEARDAMQASLSVNGQSNLILLPELKPGESVEWPIQITLDEPGEHAVRLELSSDALTGDNARYLIVDARRFVTMTIVDGDPGPVRLRVRVISFRWQ